MKAIYVFISVVFLFLFFTVQLLQAQQVDNYRQDTTTLYQRTKGFHSDPIRSKWRQEVKLQGGAWVLSLYNKKDVLQEQITFADQTLEERKGHYAFYEAGQIKLEGNYNKGYKVGEWKAYNGKQQLIQTSNYTWDKLQGLTLNYWDNGQVKERIQYVNGVKTSTQSYDQQGKLLNP